MSQVRTKFRIDRCEEEEELPVIVYLCPKCGKIDLKADEKLNKNKSFKVD
jgi:Zn finger protein HypA/HybF involved in hydrogenase expression